MRIRPLPLSLANQIAAGEVIDRPASVVKELLENALDANAHQIRITIEAGGVRLIEVSDDGVGIHPDDLPLAVMSHATSKIRVLDDLFSIQSLGFRGEALASICSVSRFSLTSKTAESSEGYELQWDDAKQAPIIQPKARSRGTTVSVQDLFFNTPVRRKFLSSEKTEWTQIENMVKRIMLSRFDVGFQLTHKTVLNLPIASNEAAIEARVKKIFGPNFLKQSIKIDVKRNDVRLWGWVGLPSLMRSQNDLQYIYLNGRTIRDKLVGHAVRSAYESSLYPGRQAMVLLYLEMPPEQVDVNVHPTKHEVRFQEPRQIHDFICSQLTQVLEQHQHQKLPNLPEKIMESPGEYTATGVMNLQWLELPYCLIKFQDDFFLCDYIQLYQSLCRNRFEQESAQQSIFSRPLLVPVRLNMPSVLELNKIIIEIPRLEKWGLSLSCLNENTLLVRSFPASLPHLNFHQWIKNWSAKIDKKEHSDENLVSSLIQANQPSWPIASHDLQAVLDDFKACLTQNNISAHLAKSYRQMKSDDWKKILKN